MPAHTGTLDRLIEILFNGSIRRLGGRLELHLTLPQHSQRLRLGLQGSGPELLVRVRVRVRVRVWVGPCSCAASSAA